MTATTRGAARRSARTAIQGSPVVALIECSQAFGWTHFTASQVAPLVVLLTAAVSFLHNQAEVRGWVRPVLKGK